MSTEMTDLFLAMSGEWGEFEVDPVTNREEALQRIREAGSVMFNLTSRIYDLEKERDAAASALLPAQHFLIQDDDDRPVIVSAAELLDVNGEHDEIREFVEHARPGDYLTVGGGAAPERVIAAVRDQGSGASSAAPCPPRGIGGAP